MRYNPKPTSIACWIYCLPFTWPSTPLACVSKATSANTHVSRTLCLLNFRSLERHVCRMKLPRKVLRFKTKTRVRKREFSQPNWALEIGKMFMGAHEQGPSPQIFRENGTKNASWKVGAFSGPIAAFWGRLGPIPQHLTAVREDQKLFRNGPFGPTVASRAKPRFRCSQRQRSFTTRIRSQLSAICLDH